MPRWWIRCRARRSFSRSTTSRSLRGKNRQGLSWGVGSVWCGPACLAPVSTRVLTLVMSVALVTFVWLAQCWISAMAVPISVMKVASKSSLRVVVLEWPEDSMPGSGWCWPPPCVSSWEGPSDSCSLVGIASAPAKSKSTEVSRIALFPAQMSWPNSVLRFHTNDKPPSGWAPR